MRDGQPCHYAPCSARADVTVELAFGLLLLCDAHWREARPELEVCATFQTASRPAGQVLAG